MSPRSDIENQPLFSKDERKKLTEVRNTLVQQLMVFEYKANVETKKPNQFAFLSDLGEEEAHVFERSAEFKRSMIDIE